MRFLSLLFGCEIAAGSSAFFSGFLLRRFSERKFLIFTDEESALAHGKNLPPWKGLDKKIVCVVRRGEDALPFFLTPDGVSCVVGEGDGVAAARYFAAVRSLPFVSFCRSFSPDALRLVVSPLVRIQNGGETDYPVPMPGALFFATDDAAVDVRGRDGLPSYFGACLLSAFCFSACEKLYGPRSDGTETLLPLLTAAAEVGAQCVAENRKENQAERETAALRAAEAVLAAEYCFARGFPRGEAFAFSALCAQAEEMRKGTENAERSLISARAAAMKTLTETYALFLEKGFYGGGTPDYRARFERAAVLKRTFGFSFSDDEGEKGRRFFVYPGLFPCRETDFEIPDFGETERRAARLEGCREKLKTEFAPVLRCVKELLPYEDGKSERENGKEKTAEKAMDKETVAAGKILRCLPELIALPRGILPLMRDFSLL